MRSCQKSYNSFLISVLRVPLLGPTSPSNSPKKKPLLEVLILTPITTVTCDLTNIGRPAVAKVQKQYGPDLGQATLREGLAQARDLLFASSCAGRALRARPIIN